MKIYTLLLEDWTIGKTISHDINVGDMAKVRLADEGGNPIDVTGEVIEILSEEDLT